MLLRDELLEEGYVIISGLISPELCNRVISDILKNTKDGMENVNQWGGVEMYHYQSQWDIRQYPPMFAVFGDLFESSDLWVTIDRCCFKKPGNEIDKGMAPHWDGNPNQQPPPFEVQGLVALDYTSEDMGGFYCVPNLYKELDSWLASMPTGKSIYSNLERIDDYAYEIRLSEYRSNIKAAGKCWWPIKQVPLNQGDLLIWHSHLAHGNGINKGDNPRFAQYVSMIPKGDKRTAQERVNCWKTNSPPSGWAFSGDPRNIERNNPTAELSSIGRKLLGLED